MNKEPLVRIDPAVTFEEYFAIALIRNECRQWMTNNRKVLKVQDQMDFWLRVTKENRSLYMVRDRGWPVGYALISADRENRRAVLTGGIAEPFRGQGMGRQLFTLLIKKALEWKYTPCLTVLRSNRRAVRLYRSLGFKTTKSTSRILTMEYRA